MDALTTPETSHYHTAIQSVLPVLKTYRETTEAARSAAPESIAALQKAELARLLTPSRHGGDEAPIRA
jgi:hypothetical protein